VRFWDSSAIVPIVAAEPMTEAMANCLLPIPMSSCGALTEVEVASALMRTARDAGQERIRDAEALLDALAATWQTIDRVTEVAVDARQLLRRYNLTAADSLQLAAALLLRRRMSTALAFVVLDQRLATAARAEGLTVLP
jgi:predicted nucleic acid-binding protein